MAAESIAIVGGGLTGLVAAWECAKQGFSVTIYEAEDGLGGLARGFPIAGTSLERTYHHIFRSDADVIALSEALGLAGTLTWNRSSVGFLEHGRLYPFSGALDLLRFSPLPFLDRVRTGLVLLWLSWRKGTAKDASVPAGAAMRSIGGEAAARILWDPLLKGKFHTYADQVCFAWLRSRLSVRARSREAGGEKLGYFTGGFQVLIDALEARLRSLGVRMLTSTPVHAIESHGAGEVTVRSAGGEETFSRVLFTGPTSRFAAAIQGNTLPDGYREKLTSVSYLGALCVVFASQQSLSQTYWTNVSDASSPFLALIQHTNLIDRSRYGGLHLYYLGTYLPSDHPLFLADDASVWGEAVQNLQRWFPNFEEKGVNEKHVFRAREAQHVPVTGYPALIPEMETPLPGVFLANFSQIFPEDRGTNAAVREGRRAGKAIVREKPSGFSLTGSLFP